MKLVIELDDDLYNFIHADRLLAMDVQEVEQAIKNGTPLPEHHGRLIDASYLLNLLKCEEYESCTWKNCSDCNREKCIKKYEILKAPTIIDGIMMNSEAIEIGTDKQKTGEHSDERC